MKPRPLAHVFDRRQLAYIEDLDDRPPGDYAHDDGTRTLVASQANVIRSQSQDDNVFHMPVLDLDVPAYLFPSSTPGHSHLYINVAMDWDDYKKLLSVLSEVGIIEEGYYKASEKRGFSTVRLPWVKKGKKK